MTRLAMLISTIITLPLLAPHVANSAPSMPVDPAAVIGAASEAAMSAFARRAGTAHVNANRNVNVNRNVNRNVNVNRAVVGGVGVVRPVRPWVRRPYYGTVVAGVALGTIIAASTIPPAPSSDLCWYWSNSSHSKGYWDYCK